jgi:hypothetical protein
MVPDHKIRDMKLFVVLVVMGIVIISIVTASALAFVAIQPTSILLAALVVPVGCAAAFIAALLIAAKADELSD